MRFKESISPTQHLTPNENGEGTLSLNMSLTCPTPVISVGFDVESSPVHSTNKVHVPFNLHRMSVHRLHAMCNKEIITKEGIP